MVRELDPLSYAGGNYTRTYEIKGENLDLIPDDAVAVFAKIVGSRTEFRYTSNTNYLFSINDRTSESITFTNGTHSLAEGTIGCIVSNDRNVLYWVNDLTPS